MSDNAQSEFMDAGGEVAGGPGLDDLAELDNAEAVADSGDGTGPRTEPVIGYQRHSPEELDQRRKRAEDQAAVAMILNGVVSSVMAVIWWIWFSHPSVGAKVPIERVILRSAPLAGYSILKSGMSGVSCVRLARGKLETLIVGCFTIAYGLIAPVLATAGICWWLVTRNHLIIVW